MVRIWGRALGALGLTLAVAGAVITCGGRVPDASADAGADAGAKGVYCHKYDGVVDGIGDANDEFNTIVQYCPPGSICRNSCGATGWYCVGIPDVYLVQTDSSACN